MSQGREPWIVVVGGFLASGKTTLILAAARELERRGLRCAALFNDQGHDLVDSRFAKDTGLRSGEVAGGCFCCQFSDLVEQIGQLCAFGPDVIFAEPVGSCTDLAATVLRPLRQLRWEEGTRFQIAPLTVLADPDRIRSLHAEDADPSMRFLFEKQVQEADLVCLTKSDLYPDCPKLDAAHVRQISAKSGQGVATWLDEVLAGTMTAGERPLEIDYEQYAKAEASLVWLNLRAHLKLREACSPTMLLGPVFDNLEAALTSNGASIAHMKAIASGPSGFVKAAIAACGQGPEIEGNLDASPATELEMLLNLRTTGEPEVVRGLVEQRMNQIDGQIVRMQLECFRPAAPVPELRIPVHAGS